MAVFWVRAFPNIAIDSVGYLRCAGAHMLNGWLIERVMVGFHIVTATSDPLTIQIPQVRGLLWGVVKLDDSDGFPNGIAPGTSPNFDWLVTGLAAPDYRIHNHSIEGVPIADATQWTHGFELIDSKARRRNDQGEGQTVWWLAQMSLDALFTPGGVFGSVWLNVLLNDNP